MNPSLKIFSGTASSNLSKEIAEHLGKELGSCKIEQFSDGEIQPNFTESLRGQDVCIIQSTYSPGDNILQLLLMIDAAKRASARKVIAVLPYFGYARQDRKDKPRVSLGAKLIANLITASGADRVVTMDLHAGQIQGFFDIPLDHLQASAVFIPYLKKLNLENIAVVAPDAGGSKRARFYAKHLMADFVLIDKHRERANQVASMQVIGDVNGKNVILVDDLVDTAGTICTAADVLLEQGANSVRALVTHPVLSGPAYDRIKSSSFEEFIITDTIPLKENIEKIKILSISRIFADAIHNIVNSESVSSLFI